MLGMIEMLREGSGSGGERGEGRGEREGVSLPSLVLLEEY